MSLHWAVWAGSPPWKRGGREEGRLVAGSLLLPSPPEAAGAPALIPTGTDRAHPGFQKIFQNNPVHCLAPPLHNPQPLPPSRACYLSCHTSDCRAGLWDYRSLWKDQKLRPREVIISNLPWILQQLRCRAWVSRPQVSWQGEDGPIRTFPTVVGAVGAACGVDRP